MGGTRFNSRGIDEEGNCANQVESEQLIEFTGKNSVTSYAFLQVRGSVPIYWEQDGVKPKVKVSRNYQSSGDAFLKHSEGIFRDYNGNSYTAVNLMSLMKPEEAMLS